MSLLKHKVYTYWNNKVICEASCTVVMAYELLQIMYKQFGKVEKSVTLDELLKTLSINEYYKWSYEDDTGIASVYITKL